MRRFGQRTHRFALAVAFVGMLAAIAVTAASADFKVDDGPCPEPPGGGPVLRCPTAHVGQAYTLQLEGEDGCAPYNWFEVLNGSLPAGLTMTREGLISGTPAGAGVGDFWVGEHDVTAAQGGPSWCNFDDQSQKEFNIQVDPGIAVANDSLAPGTVGRQYSATLAAKQVETLTPPSGPDVQATWSVQSGALPPGLALSTAGALTGTPSAEGSWQLVLAAQYGGLTATKAFAVVVRQPVVVKSAFGSAKPPKAEVGLPFSTESSATGGTGTFAWSIGAGALPAGFSLDAAKGTISGTPKAAGRFTFALTATDAEGRIATANAALSVSPRLKIATPRLRAAKRGRGYSARLALAGGVQPVRWSIVSGRLSLAVRLESKTGMLIGTPRRTGTFHVVVQARDALGATSRKPLTLRVTA